MNDWLESTDADGTVIQAIELVIAFYPQYNTTSVI